MNVNRQRVRLSSFELMKNDLKRVMDKYRGVSLSGEEVLHIANIMSSMLSPYMRGREGFSISKMLKNM